MCFVNIAIVLRHLRFILGDEKDQILVIVCIRLPARDECVEFPSEEIEGIHYPGIETVR